MRRLRQSSRFPDSLLRLAIRKVAGGQFLTGSLLLALAPAGQALTLGEINVRSTLGQRLDATVPVRLGAGEALASACVVPGYGASDLRGVPGAEVTTPQAAREGNYELQVTSASPLYEPMYELELKVQCPGAPVLMRQYVLMLDLPGAVASGAAGVPAAAIAPAAGEGSPATGPSEPGANTTTEGLAAKPAARPSAAGTRSAGRPSASTIRTGSRYRVAEGDTLSSIAARVRDRGVSLWTLAAAIQAANPEAFIRNDANLIKLGSEILIPGATVEDARTVTTGEAPVPVEAVVPAPKTTEVPATVPSPDPIEAAPSVAPAPTTLPAASAPATPTETARAQPAPQLPRAVRPKPTVADRDEPQAKTADEPNPVVAAVAGTAFGLCISALLWFRGRLPSRKPAPAKPLRATEARSPVTTKALGAAATYRELPEADTGFSVSYTPPPDDALAAEFADEPDPTVIARPARPSSVGAPAPNEDITSELDKLFESSDTTIQKRMNVEKTIAARSLGGEPRPSALPADIQPGSAVDFLVGEPPGADDTRSLETVEQPRPGANATSLSPTVDLKSLAASASKDEQQAQTLLEALTLLERDYEEELTASQVLDMSMVREALGKDADEPTQISEQPPRTKSR